MLGHSKRFSKTQTKFLLASFFAAITNTFKARRLSRELSARRSFFICTIRRQFLWGRPGALLSRCDKRRFFFILWAEKHAKIFSLEQRKTRRNKMEKWYFNREECLQLSDLILREMEGRTIRQRSRFAFASERKTQGCQRSFFSESSHSTRHVLFLMPTVNVLM